MPEEILHVSLDQKAKDIYRIRTHTIPALISVPHSALYVLNTLQNEGTVAASDVGLQQEISAKWQTIFYAGVKPQPANIYELEGAFDRLRLEHPSALLHINPSPWRGEFRTLGLFQANPELGKVAPVADKPFYGAIPVSSKDYGLNDSPFYYPPVFNIDYRMHHLADNFDRRIEGENSPEGVAVATADFYFWGIAMEHPYLGGNHRAFDRFIEYAFAKKGIDLSIPQNGTLNIPNEEPFNNAIYKERRRLLSRAGLDTTSLSLRTREDRRNWLKYQNDLTNMLDDTLRSKSYDTSEIAGALLKWTEV